MTTKVIHLMEHKRLTLFAGHYGSGKTNIAVNYALHLAGEGKKVCIGDLDIVNPYFRTADSAKELEKAGVELISPQFANSNVDLPALPAEAYRLVQDKEAYAIMDIGGDDRGAYALGRDVPFLKEENNYRMAFVANASRPLYLHRQQHQPGRRDYPGNGAEFSFLYRNPLQALGIASVAPHRGKNGSPGFGREASQCIPPATAGKIF